MVAVNFHYKNQKYGQVCLAVAAAQLPPLFDDDEEQMLIIIIILIICHYDHYHKTKYDSFDLILHVRSALFDPLFGLVNCLFHLPNCDAI